MAIFNCYVSSPEGTHIDRIESSSHEQPSTLLYKPNKNTDMQIFHSLNDFSTSVLPEPH